MIKKIILDNGLTIILNQNKKLHRTIANIYIKAGGFNTKYYIGDKEYKFDYGVAHFLEHYLIEHSKEGNLITYFSNEYIGFNGQTALYTTDYYISTVHDFEHNLVKLLNMVNDPVFDLDSLEETKKPIIAEINRKNDSKAISLNKEVCESFTKQKISNITLGEIATIKNMDIDTLERFHNVFYQPKNQILFLSGNFSDNIVELIEDLYSKYNYENIDYKLDIIDEPKEIVCKEKTVKTDIKEDILILNYKVDMSALTPLEKDKFDYYINYLFDVNYRGKSDLFNYLFNNKLTNFSINAGYDPSSIKNYAILTIQVYTSHFDEVTKLLQDKMNNLKITEKEFKECINRSIISMINRYENTNSITKNYLDNVLLYDLYQADDIEFIKQLSISELDEIMSKLDFSNYSIVRNVAE